MSIPLEQKISRHPVWGIAFARSSGYNIWERELKLMNTVFGFANASSLLLQARKGIPMSTVSYKKLWKLLIDKDLKKKDLRSATGISSASMAKLAKNENITTDVLVRICDALKCDIADIMEVKQTSDSQINKEEQV